MTELKNTWDYTRKLSPIEEAYYRDEWCIPSYDDAYIFEMLILETMQAGLSWRTVLHRREGMREALKGFSLDYLKGLTSKEEGRLLSDSRLIRHRLKIESLKKNAEAFKNIQEEYDSFATYIWSFTDGKVVEGHRKSFSEIPSSTELSDRISKDLKKRGFTFVGTTIVYSFLQSIGIVNDRIDEVSGVDSIV